MSKSCSVQSLSFLPHVARAVDYGVDSANWCNSLQQQTNNNNTIVINSKKNCLWFHWKRYICLYELLSLFSLRFSLTASLLKFLCSNWYTLSTNITIIGTYLQILYSFVKVPLNHTTDLTSTIIGYLFPTWNSYGCNVYLSAPNTKQHTSSQFDQN